MPVKGTESTKTAESIEEFKIISRFLLDENRRITRDRDDDDVYLDEFVGLLTSFYRLPTHKRDFARELLEKAQHCFELNAAPSQNS
jgi:hypothetical protein